jgi:hypothetical protein
MMMMMMMMMMILFFSVTAEKSELVNIQPTSANSVNSKFF